MFQTLSEIHKKRRNTHVNKLWHKRTNVKIIGKKQQKNKARKTCKTEKYLVATGTAKTFL